MQARSSDVTMLERRPKVRQTRRPQSGSQGVQGHTHSWTGCWRSHKVTQGGQRSCKAKYRVPKSYHIKDWVPEVARWSNREVKGHARSGTECQHLIRSRTECQSSHEVKQGGPRAVQSHGQSSGGHTRSNKEDQGHMRS